MIRQETASADRHFHGRPSEPDGDHRQRDLPYPSDDYNLPQDELVTQEQGEQKETSWYRKSICFLPTSFFDLQSNIDFLNECCPLSVQVVDCKEYPWYYKKYNWSYTQENNLKMDNNPSKNLHKPITKDLTEYTCNGSLNENVMVSIPHNNIPQSKFVTKKRKSDLTKNISCKRYKSDADLALSQANVTRLDYNYKHNTGLIGLKVVSSKQPNNISSSVITNKTRFTKVMPKPSKSKTVNAQPKPKPKEKNETITSALKLLRNLGTTIQPVANINTESSRINPTNGNVSKVGLKTTTCSKPKPKEKNETITSASKILGTTIQPALNKKPKNERNETSGNASISLPVLPATKTWDKSKPKEKKETITTASETLGTTIQTVVNKNPENEKKPTGVNAKLPIPATITCAKPSPKALLGTIVQRMGNKTTNENARISNNEFPVSPGTAVKSRQKDIFKRKKPKNKPNISPVYIANYKEYLELNHSSVPLIKNNLNEQSTNKKDIIKQKISTSSVERDSTNLVAASSSFRSNSPILPCNNNSELKKLLTIRDTKVGKDKNVHSIKPAVVSNVVYKNENITITMPSTSKNTHKKLLPSELDKLLTKGNGNDVKNIEVPITTLHNAMPNDNMKSNTKQRMKPANKFKLTPSKKTDLSNSDNNATSATSDNHYHRHNGAHTRIPSLGINNSNIIHKSTCKSNSSNRSKNLPVPSLRTEPKHSPIADVNKIARSTSTTKHPGNLGGTQEQKTSSNMKKSVRASMKTNENRQAIQQPNYATTATNKQTPNQGSQPGKVSKTEPSNNNSIASARNSTPVSMYLLNQSTFYSHGITVNGAPINFTRNNTNDVQSSLNMGYPVPYPAEHPILQLPNPSYPPPHLQHPPPPPPPHVTPLPPPPLPPQHLLTSIQPLWFTHPPPLIPNQCQNKNQPQIYGNEPVGEIKKNETDQPRDVNTVGSRNVPTILKRNGLTITPINDNKVTSENLHLEEKGADTTLKQSTNSSNNVLLRNYDDMPNIDKRETSKPGPLCMKNKTGPFAIKKMPRLTEPKTSAQSNGPQSNRGYSPALSPENEIAARLCAQMNSKLFFNAGTNTLTNFRAPNSFKGHVVMQAKKSARKCENTCKSPKSLDDIVNMRQEYEI